MKIDWQDWSNASPISKERRDEYFEELLERRYARLCNLKVAYSFTGDAMTLMIVWPDGQENLYDCKVLRTAQIKKVDAK